jgi:predicted nucleic acid-binding protein
MIYLDTSCLLKLLRGEPDSAAVGKAVYSESHIVISSLAELEALAELKAGYTGGEYTKSRWRRFEFELHHLRNLEPFYFKSLPAGLWATALRQHRNSEEIHCRALDRLHLAAAETLGITRIMTHDFSQAAAARDLNMEAVEPGR